MQITSETLVVRRGEPSFTRVDDDMVALDTASGLVYTLNSTGARVWALIEHPTSVRKVCRQLVEEFDVEPESCTAQLTELIGSLADAGLVELTPA